MNGEIELEFEYLGLSWKVEVSTEDSCLDSVFSVCVWDGKSYVEADVDSQQFAQDMRDVLDEQIEKYYLNLELVHGDLMYDSAREEGRIR